MRLLFLSALLLLSGCFNGHVKYYSLQDGSQSVMVPQSSTTGMKWVGVGPIVLPKLINRPQLVVRQSSSEFVFEEGHQWGGRLQEDIGLLLATRLQSLHANDAVYLYPADARPAPTHQWAVDIQQLDGALGGEVHLQANCRLLEKPTRHLVFQRQVYLTTASKNTSVAAYVDAQRMLLGQLASKCAWTTE